jgi:hypothetical protein
MISHQELIDNDFILIGEWNNRNYYTKRNTFFEVVEHQGYVYLFNEENPSGYGEPYKTIKELNSIYEEWREETYLLLKTYLKGLEK